ncbi:MAG TPA: hypothetical protein VIP98_20865 [Microlunatus sp.]
MTAPTPAERRIESTYRLVLTLFPSSWQDRHSEEACAILVDRAQQRGGKVSGADIADLVWHATTARLDTLTAPMLRRLPQPRRAIPGMIALTIATATSVIMIIGEITGAAHRPASPAYQAMFISGPFLTIGVGIDIGFILTMVLWLAARTELARLILFATTILAIWMTWPGGLAVYPQPPAAYTGALAIIGIISLSTLRDSTAHQPRRARTLTGLAVVVLSAVALSLNAAITGELGWIPLQTQMPSLGLQLATYAVIAALALAACGIALYTAIRHRQIGGLVLIMLFALLATTLHATAATLGSDPPTIWIWPTVCLIGTTALATVLRHQLNTNKPEPAPTIE